MLSDIFSNGGAVMTPPTTDAIFQLVDPAGTIIQP
jgi:predicted enzyme related to lactoylglutathione lyase